MHTYKCRCSVRIKLSGSSVLALWCISRVDNRYGVDRMDGQLYVDELFAVREAGLGHHFRGKG